MQQALGQMESEEQKFTEDLMAIIGEYRENMGMYPELPENIQNELDAVIQVLTREGVALKKENQEDYATLQKELGDLAAEVSGRYKTQIHTILDRW